MATTFDNVCATKSNFVGYQGDAPTNETEYDAMKANAFTGTPPTWATIQSEMDAYVSPRQSAIDKLKAATWSPLTDDEAAALFGE